MGLAMVGGRLFSGFQSLRRLVPALACALALGGCHIGKQVSFFDDEAAIETALSAIKSVSGERLRVFKIAITDDEFIVQAQNPLYRNRVQEWSTTRQQYLFLNWDRTSGPRPVDPVLINTNLEENLFELKDVNLTGWGKIADAAIVQAALESKGGVSRIEIARPAILLSRGSGEVRWTIEVRSPDESARIFANAAGALIGADLNGTKRMRSLNMYQRPELAAEAAAAVRAQAGATPILLKVSFNSTGIGFTTTLPDNSFPFSTGSLKSSAVYTWSLGGLTRGMGSMNISSHFSNPDAPFGVDEVDWALLPKIVEDARGKLAMKTGKVTSIDLTKPTDGVGKLVPLWKIDIEDNNRERGTYVADTKGLTKQVLLPKSRRAPIDWLNPGTAAETLERIGQEFGPGAKFQEIMFYDQHVSIGAQDPRKPGEVMQVLLRDEGFSRFGTVMFPGSRQNDFTLEELKLSKDAIAAALEKTLAEMKMPAGSIHRITIGRGNMSASRKGGVTMEVRAEAKGVGSGWVVFELDGSVLGVMRP